MENKKTKIKLRIKQLERRLVNKGGRSKGTITSPRRKNNSRRIARFINYNQIERNISIIIDTNLRRNTGSTVLMNLASDVFGALFFIPAASQVKKGDFLLTGFGNPKNIGDIDKLRHHVNGSLISNITLRPNHNPIFIRSAGTSGVLIRRKNYYSLVKLRSGEYRYIFSVNYATLGSLGNKDNYLQHYKNAGSSLYNRRPRNRPSARNPVDHPLGGRTRGGYPSVDIKGKLSINRPTGKANPFVIYTKRQMKFRRF